MSTREWTEDELDRVWPLPDGWAWRRCERDGSFYALATTDANTWDEGDAVEVYGEGTGLGACVRRVDRDLAIWPAPIDVALAVIGAHMGRDSPERLAQEVEQVAEWDEAPDESDMRALAEMLRRGTVKP